MLELGALAHLAPRRGVAKRPMSGKLSGMQTITVRELQKNLKSVLARVQQGSSLRVTRRRKPVAQLSPVRAIAAPPPWPDLKARAESVLGKRVVAPAAAEQIIADRGSW